jgi:hypothetical protein
MRPYLAAVVVLITTVLTLACEKNTSVKDLDTDLEKNRIALYKAMNIEGKQIKLIPMYDNISHKSGLKGSPKYIIKFLIQDNIVMLGYFKIGEAWDKGYFSVREIIIRNKEPQSDSKNYAYGRQKEVDFKTFANILRDSSKLLSLEGFDKLKPPSYKLSYEELKKL